MRRAAGSDAIKYYDGKDLRDVWGYRGGFVTRTVDSHACRLRRKVQLTPADRFVVNVWGRGYRLLE